MRVVLGGASIDENGNTSGGKRGDQKHSASAEPGFTGEVRLHAYSSINEFSNSAFGKNYDLYRAIDPTVAHTIASYMRAACINDHIGYDQSIRSEIFTYGAETTKDIGCDCSSLVSYCVTMATGKRVDASTRTLPGQLVGTGAFMPAVPAKSVNDNYPPCTGDVLVRSGHTEIIVEAAARTGVQSELVPVLYSGDASQLANYSNIYQTQSALSPRLVEPTASDPNYKYYDQQFGGGPNGSYAWGRFSEILGSMCSLNRGAPRRWYLCNEDEYSRGVAPALGAVMCYTNIYDSGDPGLACIVEAIHPDYIEVSQRHPKTYAFEVVDRRKDENESWDLDLDKDGKKEYVFQGFIYNPAVIPIESGKSKLEQFIDTALNHIGDNGAFVERLKLISDHRSQAWSAPFVVAVAMETNDLLDVIIPNATSCSEFGNRGMDKDMGSWIKGPSLGNFPNPQPGDIVFIRTNPAGAGSNRYDADKIGIVTQVGLDNLEKSAVNQTVTFPFTVTMGDQEGVVKSKQFRNNSTTVWGIFRPHWDRVDGYSELTQQNFTFQGMTVFAEGSKPEDASIRDLKYVTCDDKGVKPSINETDIMICAINYTGLLANLYSLMSQMNGNGNMVYNMWNSETSTAYQSNINNYTAALADSIDPLLSESSPYLMDANGGTITVPGQYGFGKKSLTMNNVVKAIYGELKKWLNNSAGAIGIMANMWQESGIKVDSRKGQSTGPVGLCQWLGNRRKNMETCCLEYNGIPWYDNLSGQLYFLTRELSEDKNDKYRDSIAAQSKKVCMSVQDNVQGACEACESFFKKFERAGNEGKEVPWRQELAKALWKLIRGGS